mmetsp:Transcript_11758/g.21718  ORF Transcript_11758/g.21718 Transcript_11758/m.21718 type:complete len:345 (+) Transcript_11758:1074-2108(+)
MRARHGGTTNGGVPPSFERVSREDANSRSNNIYGRPIVAKACQGIVIICSTSGRSQTTTFTVEICQGAHSCHIGKPSRLIIGSQVCRVPRSHGKSNSRFYSTINGLFIGRIIATSTETHIGDLNIPSTCDPVNAGNDSGGITGSTAIQDFNGPDTSSRCNSHYTNSIVKCSNGTRHVSPVIMIVIASSSLCTRTVICPSPRWSSATRDRAINASHNVQIGMFKIDARIDNGNIDIDASVVAVDFNVGIGVGENTFNPGGNVLRKQRDFRIRLDVGHIRIPLKGVDYRISGCLCDTEREALNDIFVDISYLNTRSGLDKTPRLFRDGSSSVGLEDDNEAAFGLSL